MKKAIILVGFLFASIGIYAQQNDVDINIATLLGNHPDSLKRAAFADLQWAAFTTNELFFYANKLIEAGKAQKNNKLVSMGWASLGYSYVRIDNASKSIEASLHALKIAEPLQDNFVKMVALHNVAWSYTSAGRSGLAVELKAARLARMAGPA